MRNALEVSKGNRMPTWNMQDMEEMFERALRNPFSLLENFRPAMMVDTRWMQPNFDIEETDQAYLLSVDLPGVKKEDVKVDLSENILTISGERKYEHESKEKGATRYERSYGQFQRSFTLPASIEVDKVEANLEDGVLRIALPKSEKAKSRPIQVGSGKGSFFSKLLGAAKKQDDKGESKGQSH